MPKISAANGPTVAGDPATDPGIDAPERSDVTRAPASLDDLAEGAYGAYCEARDWYAYDGSELPNWDDVAAEIRDAWRAAVRDTRTRLLEPAGAQAPHRRPESDEGLDDDGFRPPVDDTGAEYPDNGTAADVESWVAGNTDRARYALEREQERAGGPRAGLSASLGKLTG